MHTIRFYSLCILFLVTPIVYSWLYIPGFPWTLSESVFRISGIFIHGFEKVKVGFFFFPLLIALFAQITLVIQKKATFPKHRWIFIGSIFLLWTAVCYFLNRSINPYFWFWSPEKTHGWFLWTWLLMLFWILTTSSEKEKNTYLQIICYSFFVVFLYAIFQKIGVDPLTDFYESRLDPSRIFSTLGNPNYLAGFALMTLPILRSQNIKYTLRHREVYLSLVWILSALAVYWSKSYLAWVILPLYGIYVLTTTYVKDVPYRQLLYWWWGFIIIVVAILWLYFYWNELLTLQKVQGFIARWYLWQTGISAIFGGLGQFLFGYGPDGFFAVSEAFRHPLLSVYEDPAFRIDSSHNVIIDMIVRCGVLLTIFLIYSIGRNFHTLLTFQKEVLILFVIYFSFNIPVLIHFLIFLLVFSVRWKVVQVSSR